MRESIGTPDWSDQDLKDHLQEFSEIYAQRPIKDNRGGMKAPHMFYTWFTLKHLQPKAIIESGIWRGQGTWLIEQTCPQAELHCIDPVLERVVYRSDKARYYSQDFSQIDWTGLPMDETLVFIDDHQNAYERVKTAQWFGFRHLIFEDNYLPGQGDVYSLKKALAETGHQPEIQPLSLMTRLKRAILLLIRSHPPIHPVDPAIAPNEVDAIYLRRNLDVYYEFPPIFQASQTRWGTPWEDTPLLDSVTEPYQQVFSNDAQYYTWLCYVRLKQGQSA